MALALVATLPLAPAAMAGACRVTDFTTKALSTLSEPERLAFVMQMTQTEFDRLHAVPAGDANYYELLAKAPNIQAAKQAARAKLNTIPNGTIADFQKKWGASLSPADVLDALEVEEYAPIWASHFLNDEEMRKFADCVSARQPGLNTYGRSVSPDQFNLTFVHITPIGIEKIYTRLVASSNIANVREFEDYLAKLGPQDNYPARTFPLKLIDPKKRAVVVMRAGWETPKMVFIPVFPAREYFQ